MQRYVCRIAQARAGTSMSPCCGCLAASPSWSLAHFARWYTQRPSPDHQDQHGRLLRQRRPSTSTHSAQGRTTNSAKKVALAEVACSDTPADSPSSTAAHALGNEASAVPATDSVPQPLPSPHTRRAARSVTSAALLRSLEAHHSPLASTLRKKLVPRHTGPRGAVANPQSSHQTDEQRRTADELRAEEDRAIANDGYDPALVVRTDSRRRQVRLNHVQRELIWTARQQQYQDVLQRIVACLQSHRSPVEKCQTLFALHDEVVHHRLRLRADTYEDIFHTLYSVGVRHGGGAGQPGRASLSTNARRITGDAPWERDVCGGEAAGASGGSLPAELTSSAAASSTVLSSHGMAHVWEMYRYAVDSGTNPTARILQYVMGLLEHASVALAVSRPLPLPADATAKAVGSPRRRARSSGLLLVEAKAHSLMMDADRFHLTPSEYTINSYVGVCEACDVMHLAVARVTDYQTRHERQASAGMYARVLTGLVRCGHYEDAVAMVTTMQNVPMTTYLLNAVLQAARHSRDPASAFTFYKAIFFAPANPLRVDGASRSPQRRSEPSARSRTLLVPSLATFSTLVEVMLQTSRCAELDFVLAEMQHFRVKGNGLLLNKLLRLMQDSGKSPKEREALRRAMDSKGIRVFDESREEPNRLVSP